MSLPTQRNLLSNNQLKKIVNRAGITKMSADGYEVTGQLIDAITTKVSKMVSKITPDNKRKTISSENVERMLAQAGTNIY